MRLAVPASSRCVYRRPPDLCNRVPPRTPLCPLRRASNQRPARGVSRGGYCAPDARPPRVGSRTSPRAATRRRSTRSGGAGRARPRARRPRRRRPQPVGLHVHRDGRELVEGLAAAIAVAAERIDLGRHEGVHPRVGAADVVPFVRFRAGDPEPEHAARAARGARRCAGHPGARVRRPRRRPPAGVLPHGRSRARLAARLASGEVEPLFGPARLHPTAGAVLLGVRPPLVAFNLELDTGDVEVARAVAAAVRARDGGLPGVQALGLRLARTGRAQVSMNLIDIAATPLHRVVARGRAAGRRAAAWRLPAASSSG